MENREAILAILIDFGADITAINIAGNTPLHTAAVRNSKNCIDTLLIRGADRTTINRTGQTAEKIANLGGFNDITKTIQEFNDENIVPPPPRMPILSSQDQHLILNNVLGSLRGSSAKYTITPLPMSNHRRELIEKNSSKQTGAVNRHSSAFSLQSIDPPAGSGRDTPTKIEEERSGSPEPIASELCVVPEDVPEETAPSGVETTATAEPEQERITKVEEVKKPVTEKEKAHATLEQLRSVIDAMCIGSVDVEKVLETFHMMEKAVQPFVTD
jgi:hypothetical protein